MLKEITVFGVFLFHASPVSTPSIDARLYVVVIIQCVQEGKVVYCHEVGVDPVRYNMHSVQRSDNLSTGPLHYIHRDSKKGCHPNHGRNFVSS